MVYLMSQMQKVLHERPQGALPSNTEPNLREQVNSITTRSGLTTAKPSIPPPVPPTPRVEVEKEAKTLMDGVHITSPASTAHVPPPGIHPVSPPKPKEDSKPNPHQPKIPYPSRLTEDVIVKVEKINFLSDFVIVDFEVDPRVLIILGSPFLCTARALVDLYEEKLTLRVGNEEVVFYTNKSSRNNLRDIHSVHCINIIAFSKDKQGSGSTTSHFDDFLPAYKVFCFDIEEKSSGSTTSQSDNSLPEYESFCFDVDHIEEKSSGSTTSHSNISLPKYESFHFDLMIDPPPLADRSVSHHEEFADELAHIISPPEYDRFYFDLEIVLGDFTRVLKENISGTSTKEFTIYELNDFPLLLSDCDSIFSKDFSEIDLLVSIPSGNKDKVFDP
ncbi:hypothetical protein Tco_0060351 [Tanacetum coccineum]